MIHDQNKKRIYYDDATLEFFGFPVFFTPFLSHPDPTVHAASGLLPPSVGNSNDLGVVAHLPYYFSLAPNRDLTVEPIITTKVNPVMAAEYRENTGPGQYDVSGSITYVSKVDNQGIDIAGHKLRGHIFSKGKFALPSLDKYGGTWQWDYDAGWTSDDTYLRRYDLSKTDTLTSRATLERFGRRSYMAATTLAFQGLRVEDHFGTTPLALPQLDYHYLSAPGLLGGRYRFDGNALVLTRVDGTNTRRLSMSGGGRSRLSPPRDRFTN